MENIDVVKAFLRAQNLEQVGRIDEAVELYEAALVERFDATGPYDRLIAIYGARSLHKEVVRVVDAALDNVHTHPDKREWYERMKEAAGAAAAKVPQAARKKNG